MSNNWQPKQFRDIIDIKHGYPFKGEFFSENGKYILLTPGNFFEAGGFKRVTAKDKYYLGVFPEEYMHKKDDLIVAMTEQAEGLLGSCALVPEDNLYLHNQRLGHITMNKNEVDKKFIYYLFQMKYIRKQIRLTSTGSKVKHTSPERIYDVELFFPPFAEQQKIASILSTLDKKIELNNQINQELEAMAKTLYDYWFVQFDFPDAEGKPYKSSGGKMVYSEELKREIPEGWEVDKLSAFINIYDSQRIPLSRQEREKIKGKYPYYGATSIMDYVNNFIFDGEYILLAEDGSVMDKKGFAIIQYIWGKTWVNNHAHVLQAKNIENNEFLFYSLKMISVIKIMTGSIQKKINQENLMSIDFLMPENYMLEKFAKVAQPIRKKLINNIDETQKLTQLRDWLLPMLMNGQVKVGDVAEMVDELMVAEPSVGYGTSTGSVNDA